MGRRIFMFESRVQIDPQAGLVRFTDLKRELLIHFYKDDKGSINREQTRFERDGKWRCTTGGGAWLARVGGKQVEIDTSNLSGLKCDRMIINITLEKAERKQLIKVFKSLLDKPKNQFSTSDYWPSQWGFDNHPCTINGHIHTGFAAFYQTAGEVTPGQLIHELELARYQPEETSRLYKYLTIADDGRWIHLCDSYGYYLYHDKQLTPKLRKLAKRFDTLIICFPDADNSFDIEYWQGGLVKRKISFDDNWGEKKPPYNLVGEPFPAEAMIKYGEDPDSMLWEVARSIGIQTDYEELEFHTYVDHSPEHANGLGFNHNPDGLELPDVSK